MANQVPSADDGKDTAKSAAGPGLAGGVGVLAGSVLLGDKLGPAVGGVVGGAAQSSDDDRKNVATTGIMLAFNNMANGGGSSRSGGSTGVK